MEKDSTFETKLDYLNQHGFLLIRNALSTSLVAIWQEILYSWQKMSTPQPTGSCEPTVLSTRMAHGFL